MINIFNVFGYVLIISITLLCVYVGVIFIIDKVQKKSALRRNFPVIGRFRYLFEHLGKFFRQYFFALDREEMPFNRAERSWVYRAAKNIENTLPFGSTRDLSQVGSVIFVNSMFPVLEKDAQTLKPIVIGPYCTNPYEASALFHISGMSYGALSGAAIRALSSGAKKAGIWLNTGEGGLSDYHLMGGCDIVFQIGTAKFGVRDDLGHLDDEKLKAIATNPQVKMFEIKISQGAKPGKGGILPAKKVSQSIAKARGIVAGKDAISPNRHVEIENVGGLLDMIAHVRSITTKPVGFKMVIGSYEWLDEFFALIHTRGIESAPDFITLDSADGGTGAAPVPLLDHVGISIKESLPKFINLLETHQLRQRIRVAVSGKLINPYGVAWALCTGADFVTSARGFMFALGCIQSLQCNQNTCPTGVATHDKKLECALDPLLKSERVANYVKNLHKQVAMIAHSCGVKQPRDLNRHHARVITEPGQSQPMYEVYQK